MTARSPKKKKSDSQPPAVETAPVEPAVASGSDGRKQSRYDEEKVPYQYNVITGGGHDYNAWKSDLYHFAQLLFRESKVDWTGISP